MWRSTEAQRSAAETVHSLHGHLRSLWSCSWTNPGAPSALFFREFRDISYFLSPGVAVPFLLPLSCFLRGSLSPFCFCSAAPAPVASSSPSSWSSFCGATPVLSCATHLGTGEGWVWVSVGSTVRRAAAQSRSSSPPPFLSFDLRLLLRPGLLSHRLSNAQRRPVDPALDSPERIPLSCLQTAFEPRSCSAPTESSSSSSSSKSSSNYLVGRQGEDMIGQ